MQLTHILVGLGVMARPHRQHSLQHQVRLRRLSQLVAEILLRDRADGDNWTAAGEASKRRQNVQQVRLRL